MDFREELNGEELATLEQYGRKVRSTAGECISIDLPREVLFIVSGAVRAKAVDACGKSVVRIYATGEILNELSVLPPKYLFRASRRRRPASLYSSARARSMPWSQRLPSWRQNYFATLLSL